MAIPLGRLVQTPAGPHILLRTSSGTPMSSTIPPSIIKQSQSPQNPMRQIIVRSVQPNIVGMSSYLFSLYMKCKFESFNDFLKHAIIKRLSKS